VEEILVKVSLWNSFYATYDRRICLQDIRVDSQVDDNCMFRQPGDPLVRDDRLARVAPLGSIDQDVSLSK
jgi:hypothetical protein